jgi:hypothetical protein
LLRYRGATEVAAGAAASVSNCLSQTAVADIKSNTHPFCQELERFLVAQLVLLAQA